MSTGAYAELDPAEVDPGRLTLLLRSQGWLLRGGRRGLYSRWATEDQAGQHELLVPLDRERSDFSSLLSEAVFSLQRMALQAPHGRANGVLAGLVIPPGDGIRWGQEASAVRGTIPWPQGEDLLGSARDTLLAAAKATVSKQAYFGNKAGPYARRFLASVLMGQTEVGSYVITAFTPINEVFYESEPRDGAPPLPTVGSHTGRDITRSLTAGLEAIQEALEHHSATESYSGFVAGVDRGVSRELTQSVRGLLTSAAGAEVRVEWAPVIGPNEVLTADAPLPAAQTFQFEANAVPVLEAAALRLSRMVPPKPVRATGWVSVVRRPNRSAPGVVSIQVIAGSDAGSIRVRLTPEQFAVASDAIKFNQGITVVGVQVKEGRTNWMYHAENVVAVDVGQPPPRNPLGDRTPGPGQTLLDDAPD